MISKSLRRNNEFSNYLNHHLAALFGSIHILFVIIIVSTVEMGLC